MQIETTGNKGVPISGMKIQTQTNNYKIHIINTAHL